MLERVKFVSVTRTIDNRTGIHYLDAVDSCGNHWMAQMRTDVENWIVFSRVWYKDPQQPYPFN
jgi:hypothetical protein